jgi:hypothetical protein
VSRRVRVPESAPNPSNVPALKFSTGWIGVEVLSEPDVTLTVRGYAPILQVRDINTNLNYIMYVGAKSLSEKLEPLRLANGRRFTGLRLRICKESEDPMSKYKVESIIGTTK